ncbi:hypothetical protein GQ44DRAFT_402472 [Phaeosphaeriaceae sp. PMI808]|nr:hypothetical protein GQ44DRAFT_402472 [Phaeosphaeriaceae sp. PMI808]
MNCPEFAPTQPSCVAPSLSAKSELEACELMEMCSMAIAIAMQFKFRTMMTMMQWTYDPLPLVAVVLWLASRVSEKRLLVSPHPSLHSMWCYLLLSSVCVPLGGARSERLKIYCDRAIARVATSTVGAMDDPSSIPIRRTSISTSFTASHSSPTCRKQHSCTI